MLRCIGISVNQSITVSFRYSFLLTTRDDIVELWLLIAVVAALLKTGYSTLQKHLTVEYDGLELSYVTSVLGLAFIAPIGLWSASTNDFTPTTTLLAMVLLSGIVNIAAIYFFLTALELEDLSVIAPLVQVTPIFVAISEPFVLRTPFETTILFGAVLAVVGGYVLLTDTRALLYPLAGVSTRAATLALAAAGFFAVTSLANRFVTVRMAPFFYAFLIYLIMSVGFAIILYSRRNHVPSSDLLQGKLLVLGGITSLRTSVTYVAFSLAAASRVSVALQLSIVCSIFAGGLFFGERNILRKAIGAALIISGIIFVV